MSMHLAQPLADPRTYVAGLSEGLCRVIRKMMAKDRGERYADVDTLDRDLYRLQTGEAPEGAEPGDTAVETVIRDDVRAAPGRAGSGPSPAATPTHTPTPHPAFDSGVLNRVEELLAADVGPMARVLVRRAAKTAPSLEALCGALAEQVETGRAREAFRSKCLLAARPAAPPPAPAPPRTPPPPHGSTVPRTTPPPLEKRATPAPSHSTPGASLGGAGNTLYVTEGDLHFLEAELAKHVGPLARVLVKRASKSAGSLSALAAALEAEIPSDDARRAFRAAVKKLR